MKIYLPTIDVDTTGRVEDAVFVSLDYDVKRYNVNFMAPELLTVTIVLKDQSGSSLTFRLTRDGYDLFRQKVIEAEGYPK